MSLVERVNTISEMSRIYRKHRDDFGEQKFQRMLVAMEDVKAVLVKLADRMHNMRTLGCLPREKQVLLAQETLEVYSVVANRLGVWGIKAELEDLAFKALHPEEYEWLREAVAHRQDAAALEATMNTIRGAMLAHGVQVEDISGRPKNLWGIWRKMQADGHRDLGRIFDVQALRVVVSNKHECYVALRALESVYRCMPGRSKVSAWREHTTPRKAQPAAGVSCCPPAVGLVAATYLYLRACVRAASHSPAHNPMHAHGLPMLSMRAGT